MTWTKLSDDFGDQCANLSDHAFRTHVEGLMWSMRRETDGVITMRDLRRFAESPDWMAAVDELVAAHYWETFDNGFLIMHHMEHQPEAEVIAQRRAKRTERQQHRAAKFTGAIHARDGYACRYCGPGVPVPYHARLSVNA